MRKLTAEEQRAIDSLRRLCKRWPRTIGLQAGNIGLNIIALDAPDIFPEPGRGWNERHIGNVDFPAEGGDPW